jgi:hypothetical protein
MKNRNQVRYHQTVEALGSLTKHNDSNVVRVNGKPGTWTMVNNNGQRGCQFDSLDGTLSFLVEIQGDGDELRAGALREI